jgi:hypothetical protein
MKFSTICTAAFSAFALVLAEAQPKAHAQIQARQLTPVSDPLSLDVVGRDLSGLYKLEERDLLDVVESLVSSINITSIISSIDFESIAGWVDRLLNTNNNVQYLDDLLNFVADTDLVPFLISFIISNNSTRSIAGSVVVDLLGVAGNFDLTPVFEALKDSGLAYEVIADLIKNPNTFPFVKQVVVDLLNGAGSGSNAAATSSIVFATTGTTSFSFATATAAGTAGAGSGGAATYSISGSLIDTGIGFSGSGVVSGLNGPVAQTSTSIGSIDTASLAGLFSQAAAEQDGGDATAAAAVTGIASATTVAITAVTTNAAASVSAQVTAVAASGDDSYLGITGPAFQSLPPSQFGAGPTSINLSALSGITAALSNKRDLEQRAPEVEERNDPVASALQKMRAKRAEQFKRDPVAMILEEIRKREIETSQVEDAIMKMKRDNIENLLTTIFSSVARSDIINETINYLVTDQRFEQSVVTLLRGVFSNLGSTLTGVLNFDWASLVPLIRSLINSGLITDIIERAFNDPELGSALWNDITLLFKRDLALREEVLALINNGTSAEVSSLPVSEFITATVATSTHSDTTLSVSSVGESGSAAPEVSVIQSENAGFSFGASIYSTFFTMLAVFTMML